MLRTDEIRDLLSKNKKPMKFDDIWKNVSSLIKSSISKELKEEAIKSNLLISLMEDSRLIMIGDGKWDLREKYSLDNQELINKARITEETELVWEESDDTKELNLKIVNKDE